MENLIIVFFLFGAFYFLSKVFPFPLFFGKIAVYLYQKENFIQAFFWVRFSENNLIEEKIVKKIEKRYKVLEEEIRKSQYPERVKVIEALKSLVILEDKNIYLKQAINYIVLVEAAKRIEDPRLLKEIAIFIPGESWKKKIRADSVRIQLEIQVEKNSRKQNRRK